MSIQIGKGSGKLTGRELQMSDMMEHVCVGICTFQRSEMVARLLQKIAAQETDGLFDLSIVIVDNDIAETARSVVTEFARQSEIPTAYFVEPVPNIARARNRVVANANGDYLAFIDDDEFPSNTWLREMRESCKRAGSAGVLGPVQSHFETEPPVWLERGGFYVRPRYPTGTEIGWQNSRTGNVLLRRSVLRDVSPVFDEAFGEGGEDLDFFRRMGAGGHRFTWCDEAPVFETVPPHRWERKFLLRRAFLRGNISFSQGKNRIRNLLKAVLAVPIYTMALPFLFVAGQHLFMRYFVRLCDHLGRLLALLRLNPIRERNH